MVSSFFLQQKKTQAPDVFLLEAISIKFPIIDACVQVFLVRQLHHTYIAKGSIIHAVFFPTIMITFLEIF